MDKYEFNIKVEQLRKLVNRGDYETAMKIADTIDWKKVRNANLLSMVAQVYEKNEEYQDAKDILLLAFERAPIGKRLLYKLTELALKEGNTSEAEAYYREFCDLAGDDPREQLLRYLILKQKNAPMEQLIHSLEGYTAEELDEKWLYELAELYHEAGEDEKCVAACDKLMLMFGLGKYVDRAMELKLQYAPLTKYQMDLVENREKYEAKLRAVEQSFNDVTDQEDEYIGGAATAPEIQEEETAEHPADAVVQSPEEPVISEEPEVTPEAVPDTAKTVQVQYAQEDITAAFKQAETEEHLAKEMSRLTADGASPTEEDEMGKTRVLGDIKHAKTFPQETTVLPDISKLIDNAKASASHRTENQVKAQKPEAPVITEEEEDMALPKLANHLMIEARTPERGLQMAMEALKQIQKETGVKNPVAKITGSKMNKRGILASADKLAGKDLMIEEAGDLSQEMLKELEKLMAQDTSGMRIILIDNPKQMETLHVQNPSLSGKFECIGCENLSADKAPVGETSQAAEETVSQTVTDDRPVRRVVPVRDTAMRTPEKEDYPDEVAEEEPAASDSDNPEDEEEMGIDEFAQYACKYASEIDCSITGKSMLALYERIEIMEEDGIRLTQAAAEELIEEAADKAEKPSLGKLITGVFSSKYDKDGLLILKEEHFI